jgi:hypothetical protein
MEILLLFLFIYDSLILFLPCGFPGMRSQEFCDLCCQFNITLVNNSIQNHYHSCIDWVPGNAGTVIHIVLN